MYRTKDMICVLGLSTSGEKFIEERIDIWPFLQLMTTLTHYNLLILTIGLSKSQEFITTKKQTS